jgi:hypothetical protein
MSWPMIIGDIERWVDANGYLCPLRSTEAIRHHRVHFIRSGEERPVKVGFSTHLQQRLIMLSELAHRFGFESDQGGT